MASLMSASVKGFSYAIGIVAIIYVTDIGYWGCKDSLKKLLRFYTLASLAFSSYFYFTSEEEEEVPVTEALPQDPPPQDPPPIDCPAPQDPQPQDPPPQNPPPIICPPRPRAPTQPPATPVGPFCVQCGFIHPTGRHAW